MSVIEGAGQVRAEDEFNVESVRTWLSGHGRELLGDIEVQQFAGGASNLTFSLRTSRDDLILRRPPAGSKAKGAHDMGREYRIQSALKDPFGLVADMVAFCDDESVIGSEFYVMERVDGVIPRRNLPQELHLDMDDVERLCTNALDTLVRLHRVDPAETGLTGKGLGYVRRQVEGWSTRYRNAVTDDAASFEPVMTWLAQHQPPDVANVLIHNDFRFDNLVLDRSDPTRIVALLDWEMATLGDPLMDLGGTLAYWVQDSDDEFFQQFRRQPTNLPGMLSREEVVAYYCDAMGFSITPEQWRFYEIFGLFRLGVISQQIYYRYFHKQTSNEAFAIFGPAAHYLEQRCLRIIGAR